MIKKFWNRRILGIPTASYIILKAVYTRVYEQISSSFYRFNLGNCGKNVIIQKGAVIRHPKNIHLGDNINIGRNVNINTEYNDSILKIGEGSQLNVDSHIDFTGGLSIGDNVVISERSMIFTHSHGHDPKSKPIKKPLIIEDNVWIGANCVITENVEVIGENALIAAGSVVTMNIEPNSIYGGNPCRFIKVKNEIL